MFTFMLLKVLNDLSFLLQEMRDYDDKKKGKGRRPAEDSEESLGVRKKLKMRHKGGKT